MNGIDNRSEIMPVPVVHTSSARQQVIARNANKVVKDCAAARAAVDLPGVLLGVRGYVHYPGEGERKARRPHWIAWQGIGGSLCTMTAEEAIDLGELLKQFLGLVRTQGVDAVGNALDVLALPGGAQAIEQVAERLSQ